MKEIQCSYIISTVLTSLFRYRELIISFIIRLTSAWKANFSAFSLSSFICATLRPSSLIASSSLSTALSSVFEASLLFPTSSSTFGGSVSVFSSAFSSSAKQRAKQEPQKITLYHYICQSKKTVVDTLAASMGTLFRPYVILGVMINSPFLTG